MPTEGSKFRRILLWAGSVLLALAFVGAGSVKLLNPAMAGGMFANYGYPAWFAVVIGVVEVVGGLLLLVPRLAAYAAGALIVVTAGAVFTHLRAGEVQQSIIPLVLLLLLALVAWVRKRN